MSRLRTTFPLMAVLLLASCQPDNQTHVRHEISGTTMGTTYSISMVAESNFDVATMILAIDQRLGSLESTMSTYEPKSGLSRFNAFDSTEWFKVTADLCAAVAHSIKISEVTNGAFDVTVGRLVNLWGFGPYSLFDTLPTEDEISQAVGHTGYAKLATDCSRPALMKTDVELHVDLSAYAKGLAVDEIAWLLVEVGVNHFLVEIGGELRTSGLNESGEIWRVAIETPLDTTRGVQLIVNAPNLAIATSGNYRNFYIRNDTRYSHIIDPRSGRPVAHSLGSVTVAVTDAAHADGLATALMVMGTTQGLEFAEKHAIAALFLSYENAAVAETMTSEFRQLIAD